MNEPSKLEPNCGASSSRSLPPILQQSLKEVSPPCLHHHPWEWILWVSKIHGQVSIFARLHYKSWTLKLTECNKIWRLDSEAWPQKILNATCCGKYIVILHMRESTSWTKVYSKCSSWWWTWHRGSVHIQMCIYRSIHEPLSQKRTKPS